MELDNKERELREKWVRTEKVTARPATVDQATSPSREIPTPAPRGGDLRVFMREIVREELGGTGGGKVVRGISSEMRNAERRPAKTEGRGGQLAISAVIHIRDCRGFSYADVLRTLRKKVGHEQLGRKKANVQVTPDGAARIVLRGSDRDEARLVTARFKEVLGTGA